MSLGSVCESRSFFQCSEEAGRYFWRNASIPAAAYAAYVFKFERLSNSCFWNDCVSRHQIADGKEAEQEASQAARPIRRGGSKASSARVSATGISCNNGSIGDAAGSPTWLPNVRGPKVIADKNGQYHDASMRFVECSRDQETSASSENLVTPGTFEFELSSCPSMLIFSTEGHGKTQHTQHVGAFLAGLMRSDIPSRTDLVGSPRSDVETGAQLVA